MLTSTSRQARARLGSISATARRRPDDADAAHAVQVARREYAAESLADHIRKVVAEAPPLTPEQRDRLTVLLRGGPS